eukprot:29491-Pelagococcus_subviridis.AAC.2
MPRAPTERETRDSFTKIVVIFVNITTPRSHSTEGSTRTVIASATQGLARQALRKRGPGCP